MAIVGMGNNQLFVNLEFSVQQWWFTLRRYSTQCRTCPIFETTIKNNNSMVF